MRNSKCYLSLALVCSFMLSLSSCRDDSEEPSPPVIDTVANRSVLVYMAAENSLSSFAHEDLAELIKGATNVPSDDNLFVFMDDANSRRNPRIYKVFNNNGKGDTLCVKQYASEVNSAAPSVLADVLKYIETNYDSKSLGLVMWSHGDGWIPSSSVASRYIGIDNNQNSTSNSGTEMDIWDMASAISPYKDKMDFILFDACFMQTIEVAYELKDCARYLIASPCEIPAPGAPYDLMITPMFASTFDAANLSAAYYHYYNDNVISDSGMRYGALLSAIDCSKIDDLAEISATYIAQYFGTNVTMSSSNLVQYGYGGRNNLYLDMNEVMQKTLGAVEYQTWKASFDAAVISSNLTSWWYVDILKTTITRDLTNCGGVAMFVPQLNSANQLLSFKKTKWYEKGGWKALGW